MPFEVRRAIYAMWISLAVTTACTVWQIKGDPGEIELYVTLGILVLTVYMYSQISVGKMWARDSYLLVLVFVYSMLALDEDGLSTIDFANLLITGPLDICVIWRLYSTKATQWFESGEATNKLL